MVLIPRPGAAANAPPEPEDLMPQEPAPVLEKPDAGTPSLEAILRSAARYLDAYEQEASALVSEETYLQKTPEPDPKTNAVSRQLRSDMLIIPDATVGWLGFRDVFEVDGEQVHNRTDRLTALFMRPLPDRMGQARRIVLESARFNLRSDIFRTVNMPMMALRFLRFVDQHRSKFTLDGLQVVDGARVALVRFEEQTKPRMIESNDAAPARGAFWIEPRTGRVVQSELLFDTGKRPPACAFACGSATARSPSDRRQEPQQRRRVGSLRRWTRNTVLARAPSRSKATPRTRTTASSRSKPPRR